MAHVEGRCAPFELYQTFSVRWTDSKVTGVKRSAPLVVRGEVKVDPPVTHITLVSGEQADGR